MVCNLGAAERVIRVGLGVILIAVGYFAAIPGPWAVAAYVIGAVAVVTAAAGFCPAWRLLGINTCAKT
jgi:hypothetical protein